MVAVTTCWLNKEHNDAVALKCWKYQWYSLLSTSVIAKFGGLIYFISTILQIQTLVNLYVVNSLLVKSQCVLPTIIFNYTLLFVLPMRISISLYKNVYCQKIGEFCLLSGTRILH